LGVCDVFRWVWLFVSRDGRGHEDHFFFFLVDAGFSPNQLHPFLRFFLTRRLNVEVASWRKEPKDMFGFAFGVFQSRDRGEVGKGKLMTQLCTFGWVFVDAKEIRSQYEKNRFPCLIYIVNPVGGSIFSIPLTFVFLVRFNTSADFITRSNSKLPFWLTGEKVSRVKCAL